jgi:epoxyqueuosine reductase
MSLSENVPVSSSQIKEKARSLGFHSCGIAAVDTDTDESAVRHLKAWLALGYQADMGWMDNPKRFDIRACMPEVQVSHLCGSQLLHPSPAS